MLLRHSLRHESAATVIEAAVGQVLTKGYRTPDIRQPGADLLVGTRQMGDLVAERVAKGRGEGIGKGPQSPATPQP
jgi:3-isopropylmalate dehydrogenase